MPPPPGGALGGVAPGVAGSGGVSGSPGGGWFTANRVGGCGVAMAVGNGSSGDTGPTGVSETRFPQRVRAS
jgi:hypothetical protein